MKQEYSCYHLGYKCTSCGKGVPRSFLWPTQCCPYCGVLRIELEECSGKTLTTTSGLFGYRVTTEFIPKENL